MPLDETINILVNKAFADDWFNKTHGLNLQKDQLVKLLEIATTSQLFQFDGLLYEQTDGVAMGFYRQMLFQVTSSNNNNK